MKDWQSQAHQSHTTIGTSSSVSFLRQRSKQVRARVSICRLP